jgi:hypothetical protein
VLFAILDECGPALNLPRLDFVTLEISTKEHRKRMMKALSAQHKSEHPSVPFTEIIKLSDVVVGDEANCTQSDSGEL